MSEPEQPWPWQPQQPSYQQAQPGQPYLGYPVGPPPNPYGYAPASRYAYAPPSHRGRNVIIGSIVATLAIVVAVVAVTGSQSPKAKVSAGKGTAVAHSPVAPSASNPPNPAGGITASSPLNSPLGTSVIFSDDFGDPNSGWDTGADDDSTYTYTSNGYSMTTNAPAVFLSYAPDDTPAQQVSLSVTAVETPGADPDAGYGASCRRGPGSTSQLRYEFRITGSGHWFIERNTGDLSAQTPTILDQGPTQMLAGTGGTVSAVCATLADGTTTRLALFLNGTKVADTLDVATADGAGWLGAILSTNPGTAPTTTVVRYYTDSALGPLPILAANT